MKRSLFVITLFVVCIVRLQAQVATPAQSPVPPSTPWQVVEQGANHNLWQMTSYEFGPDGKATPHIHQFTELASGLNYKDSSQNWQPSQESIESFSGGAVARNGQYQVIFANNLNTYGAIDQQTPDGKRLRSNILGLMYRDTSTGKEVLIAKLQNSTGILISANKVLYANAFNGVNADVCYTYRKGSFDQDIILRAQPPAPETLGLNPATTELEAMTEFINPPSATVTVNSSLSDETINWGEMRLGRGRAFDLGSVQENHSRALVRKKYMNYQGNGILFEKVQLPQIQSGLSQLPAQSRLNSSFHFKYANNFVIPALPSGMAEKKPINMAKKRIKEDGFVLDYTEILSDETNYVFQGDMTYYISSQYNLDGTTKIEGETVLKFGQPSGGLLCNGNLVCETGPYRPAVFTSQNDNTVGETISGSTGVPGEGGNYLELAAQTNSLHDLRMLYANTFIAYEADPPLKIWDSQFMNCPTNSEALEFANAETLVVLNNDLFSQCGALTYNDGSGNGGIIGANNLTLDQIPLGICLPGETCMGNLTNCILTDVGDTNGLSLNASAVLANGNGVYQVAEGGDYYLAAGSQYQNAGNAAIDPAVLADLDSKTTYPPIVYTNATFTNEITFVPQAARNSGVPDLGYHYDPVDYAFGGCTMTTNVTFSPGTVVGWFRTSSGWYHAGQGIQMSGNMTVSFDGTVTSPTFWVRLNTVQEQDKTAGYGHGGIENWSGPDIPVVMGHFLMCSAMAGESFNSYFCDDYGSIQSVMNDSEFWGGNLGTYGDYMFYTNCLMWETYLGLWNGNSQSARTIQNCTFICGVVDIGRSSSGPTPVIIRDSSFDGTSINTDDAFATNTNLSDYNFNAYTNSTDPFSVGGANDKQMPGGFDWQSSWFGIFYLPTNSSLIQAGDLAASRLGLYHFTTQTNQEVDGTNLVTIGYHYVGTDTNGNPLDSNGDGIPDYLEDANGDGLVDNGEANWALAILGQPANQTAAQNGSATFNVTAKGINPVYFQWFFGQTNLAGETNSILELTNVQPAQAGNYFVIVSNYFGSLTSSVASLDVVPVEITMQPTNQTTLFGENAFFSISADAFGSCAGPLTYQWLLDGTNLPVNNGIITTIAGNGPNAAGFSGDGGEATNALLNYPNGLDLDDFGNIYIADTQNNAIRKIDTNGIIRTIAGNSVQGGYSGDGGFATNANLYLPFAESADKLGNIYIADTYNSAIRKVDTEGIITTIAGNGSSGFSGDGGYATNSQLSYPFGLAVDPLGDIYIADSDNMRIRKIDTNGVITTVAGNGNSGYSGDGGWATNAALQYPYGVAVDSVGNLFIADSYNSVVREVGTNGIITTLAGNHTAGYSGDGGAATNASLNFPHALAVDSTGNVYISDSYNNVVRMVSTNGTIETIAGNGGSGYSGDGGFATNAEFYVPQGVSLDSSGKDLYIADSYNNAVRKVVQNIAASGSELMLYGVTNANSGDYQAIITSPCGSVTSSVASLLIYPSITEQPASQAVWLGTSPTFSVNISASSIPPISYQWFFNGQSMGAAGTAATLTLTNVQTSQAGSYSVVVKNAAGGISSRQANLVVYTPIYFAGNNFQILITEPKNMVALP